MNDHSKTIKAKAIYILDHIVDEYEIDVEKSEDMYFVTIKTEEEASTLIGRHGDTVRAFQRILEVMLFKEIAERVYVVVDVNDYRLKQKERLEYIATQHAEAVMESESPAYLRGFSAYERRIIHEYVTQTYENLASYSLGEGRDRRLVITIKREGEEQEDE